ncbi:hypothetical protein AYO47_07425 [Planctomyces sp. SCGC AG-212-M04]|nr:hypothetical protein AYO47_07425 [Planctomyces sp. SCGC AG-212-M04]
MLVVLQQLALGLTFLASFYPPKDLERELKAAGDRVDAVRPAAEALMAKGEYDKANETLLAVFPDGQRTPAQALVLGNVLFNQLPSASYRLHKEAAQAFVDELNVQLEWALEQHRAGEYDAARITWEKVCKKAPDQAIYHALRAECLIRTHRIVEAVAAWQASEAAPAGKREEFEGLLFGLKNRKSPHQERSALLHEVRSGDIAAAEKLVLLDATFRTNWWISEPNLDYLDADIALVGETEFSDKPRQQVLRVFADIVRSDRKKDGAVEKQIRESGLFFDKKTTLPASDVVMASLLGLILESKIKAREEAFAIFGQKVIERARKSKEPELWNVLCNLTLGSELYRANAQKAGEVTGESRFAVGFITDLERTDELTSDHPDLLRAIEQFPEDSILAQLRLRRALKEGRPLRPYLEAAIKAEYTKLSPSPSPLGLRPSSVALRIYFGQLAQIVAGESR